MVSLVAGALAHKIIVSLDGDWLYNEHPMVQAGLVFRERI